MIKLIVFDWDDVFTLGSTKGYYACYHAAIAGVGVNLSKEEEAERIASKWGAPHRQEIEALLPDNPELVDDAVEIYEKALFGDIFINELSIIDGAQDLLTELSKDYTLAIASGVHPQLLKERIFPKFNIPSVFSQIITAYDIDDPAKSKPHPHTIELIMERNGVKPEETIMIGDAKNDIMMAKSAGTKSAAVLTGHLNREQAEELNPDFIIENVTKLKECLRA